MTLLSAADWQDVFLDQQRQVRRGEPRSGPWGLDVARNGEYTFELRRWPREANASLNAALPVFKHVDGELPDGKALPIAKAKLRVDEIEQMRDVKTDDTFVSFTIPLTSGPTQAKTWFYNADGK